MTATHAPGLPIVEDGLLVSTNPATGEAAARVPIARADDVAAAVDRARAAAAWWAGLGCRPGTWSTSLGAWCPPTSER
jgi:succinate-semialdehyde dehydrogenase / glutarate-semialdehyde dehydrogenase